MITKDEALSLRGQRVSAKLADGTESNWILRAYTPADKVILAGEGGRERVEDAKDVLALEYDPIICPTCEAEHNVDRESQRCAHCERQWMYKQPKPSETCEDCEKQGAVYSPLARAFRCLQCHAKAGTLTGLGPEARVVTQAAPCRSDDLHSERHDWKKLKSSYICKNCEIRTHSKPDGYR